MLSLSDILLTLTSVLLVYTFMFYWKNRRLFLLTRHLPGPLTLPLIGGTHIFIQKKPSDAYQVVQKVYEHYPDESKVWLGPNLMILLKSPENFQSVLNCAEAYNKTDMIYQWTKTLGPSAIIGAPVDIWKKHRKLANKSFSHNILKKSLDVMTAKAEFFAENLLNNDYSQIYGNFITCTADITAQTLFDYDLDYQRKKPAFGNLMWEWLEISYVRIFKLWCQISFLFKYTAEYRSDQVMRKELDIVTNLILENKKKLMENQKDDEEIEENQKSLLDNLINSPIMDEQEIRDEIHTFLLAGAETTANAGCFTLMTLGIHQHIQDRVYNEIIDVLGTNDVIQVEDLPKLKYTEQAIKETLRLFPVIPMIARLVESDIILKSGTIIPKGANVSLNFFLCQRDEKYWDDPMTFDPDRFLPENCAKRHAYAYCSFSAGARNCIGHLNAVLVLKCILVSILKRYRVFSDYKAIGDVKVKMNVMCKPIDGYQLSFKPRYRSD